jgi:hypothetical protein
MTQQGIFHQFEEIKDDLRAKRLVIDARVDMPGTG